MADLTAHLQAGGEGGLVSLHVLALLVPGILPALTLLYQLLHLSHGSLVILAHLRHCILALLHCCLGLVLCLLESLQCAQR